MAARRDGQAYGSADRAERRDVADDPVSRVCQAYYRSTCDPTQLFGATRFEESIIPLERVKAESDRIFWMPDGMRHMQPQCAGSVRNRFSLRGNCPALGSQKERLFAGGIIIYIVNERPRDSRAAVHSHYIFGILARCGLR